MGDINFYIAVIIFGKSGYMEIMGRNNATIATTTLFTVLHGGAFEAGAVPVLNVLTMSLLMTVALEYSGSMIAPAIMHFLWNGISALVLGGVSLADDYPNLLITTFPGNEILSGGVCKIEGSLWRQHEKTNSIYYSNSMCFVDNRVWSFKQCRGSHWCR